MILGKKMLRRALMGTAVLGIGGVAIGAAPAGLEGNWAAPEGSVIRVYGCGEGVCAKVVVVEASAPGTTDQNNPDDALRSRSLCGLEIGQGFKRDDDTHASGGTLYDPKSGKTYSGTMVAEGDSLKLRGFIGVSLFGRTETWKRVVGAVKACKAS